MALHASDFVNSLRAIPEMNRESLADFIRINPNTIPLLATVGGMGQEQLKNQLKFRFMTSSWKKLAREQSLDLITYLDRSSTDLRSKSKKYDRWSLHAAIIGGSEKGYRHGIMET